MNKIVKIVLISVGIGGASLVGGISLVNIGISIEDKPKQPLSAEELAEQSDIENSKDGLRAMEEEDFFAALVYFHAISDESESVTNKDELLQDAALGYLSDILEKTDGELDYDNFNQAKIYLEEAISLMPDNSKLLQEYNHVLLREQLYTIINTDTAEAVLKFIRNHWENLQNDTYVVDTFSEYREEYVNDISQEVNDLIDRLDYESARQVVTSAEKVIGASDKLEEIQEQIWNAEIKGHIENLTEQEQWRELILYLDADPTIKTEYASSYNSAFHNYKNEIMDQVEEALAVNEYEKAKRILLSAHDILYTDDEFMQLYDQYKDYSSNVFRFCPVINDEIIEYGEAHDISSTDYSNVIKIRHNQNERTIVFQLPVDNFSRFSGTFFICQDENYPYEEEDTGETTVCFYDEETEDSIESYEGITYMNSVPFNIPISNVKYLTVKVKRTTSRNVILGIRDGYLS